MTFLQPHFWPVLLVLVALALVYFLPVPKTQRAVTTLFLWRQVVARRSFWSRWAPLASFLVHSLILLLLAAAVLRPVSRPDPAGARAVVIVLDTSASMQARDVPPSRLEAARKLALEAVDALGELDRAAVLSVGNIVRIEARFTRHRARLREAIRATQPTDAEGQLAMALPLARRLVTRYATEVDPLFPLDREPSAEKLKKACPILVYTDGCQPLTAPQETKTSLRRYVVGKVTPNRGVTLLSARRDLRHPARYVVLAEVRCAAADGPVAYQWSLDGQKHESGQVRLSADRPAIVSTTVSAGHVRLELQEDDPLSTDNGAGLVLPPLAPRKIVVVSQDPKRLEAWTGKQSWAEVISATKPPARLGPGEVLVADQTPLAAAVEGPVILIQPPGAGVWGKADSAAVTGGGNWLAKGETVPAWLAPLDVSRVYLAEPTVLQPAAKARILIRAGPARPQVFEIDRPQGPLLVVADLGAESSDLRGAIEELLTRAADNYAHVSSEPLVALRVGQVARVAPSDQARTLQGPEDAKRAFPAGQSIVGPFSRAGLWKLVSGEGGATIEFPVAVQSPAEVDLQPILSTKGEKLERHGDSFEFWPWLLCGAFVLWLGDWIAHRFRITV